MERRKSELFNSIFNSKENKDKLSRDTVVLATYLNIFSQFINNAEYEAVFTKLLLIHYNILLYGTDRKGFLSFLYKYFITYIIHLQFQKRKRTSNN